MWKKIRLLFIILFIGFILSGCGHTYSDTEGKIYTKTIAEKKEKKAPSSSKIISDDNEEINEQNHKNEGDAASPEKPEPQNEENKTDNNSANKIKSEINLPVPFSPQAPFANWDMPYQEACEEASAIMAAKYFKNKPLNAEIMDREILDLVDWQNEHFGYYEDTTAREVVTILEEYFGLNAYLNAEVETERIKYELSQGNLIIIPAAGQMLGNPYFSGDGPPYHMLLIRGYDGNEFITNDPGTKRGEGFRYKYNTLLNAIHDWTGSKETIREGRKVMIIVSGA